jgi:hypothetical protein
MPESRRIIGRWRITEMDNWDQEAVDLVKPGFIEFDEDGLGELGFIAGVLHPLKRGSLPGSDGVRPRPQGALTLRQIHATPIGHAVAATGSTSASSS